MTNVHFLGTNANVDLQPILTHLRNPEDDHPQVEIDTICFQFPDPHFKSKHKKRRVVNGNLVNCIAQYVKAGTQVFLQSDIQDLAEDMTQHFASRSAALTLPVTLTLTLALSLTLPLPLPAPASTVPRVTTRPNCS